MTTITDSQLEQIIDGLFTGIEKGSVKIEVLEAGSDMTRREVGQIWDRIITLEKAMMGDTTPTCESIENGNGRPMTPSEANDDIRKAVELDMLDRVRVALQDAAVAEYGRAWSYGQAHTFALAAIGAMK